jgi:hypothetical protein
MNSPMLKHLMILTLLCFGLVATAQPGTPPPSRGDGDRFERIKKARQAFIAEYLELTDAEAEAFFPIFWKYDVQMHRLKRAIFENRPGRRQDRRNLPPAPALSEEDAKKQLLEVRENRRKLLELNLEAEAAYLEVLPAAKLIQLEEAEKMFRQRLWDRAKRARRRN